ncbi:MAG: helix-turn-helix domain-containing protein [Oscillibacter sp.]|jgi:transcriptional regulator with XRE-family HTH domain|nr:helix-turn-helix domain-containing protein [Oscillibacter sp.]
MTLGEHIQQLRKKQGLSQEALGDALGVSRQAVSKWETGQTLPDTSNLLAMAELFRVSADDLAGKKQSGAGAGRGAAGGAEPASGAAVSEGAVTPDTAADLHRRGHRKVFFLVMAICLAACLGGLLLWRLHRVPGASPDSSAAAGQSAGETAPALSEFTFAWADEAGSTQHLSLGMQKDFFPYGTSLRLTERDWSYQGDDTRAVHHDADCGGLHLTYAHVTDPQDPRGEWETAEKISSIAEGYATPRGIGVGSPRADLLDAYGDELIYCRKETGSGILVRHDCYYAWQSLDGGAGAAAILFYMQDGHVAGLRLELLGDRGTDAYAPDNIFRFPVKGGEPDFSQRVEPDTEVVDQTRAVYIAFTALTADENLSAEEQYEKRRTIFQNLRVVDWQEYGALGEAGKEDETRGALLRWLETLGDFSRDELLELQLGCESNLDGWLSEDYSSALANAFFLYPIEFTRLLADNEGSLENSRTVVLHTLYGAELSPEREQPALDTVERFGLTGREGAWADYLLSCAGAGLENAAKVPLPEGVR